MKTEKNLLKRRLKILTKKLAYEKKKPASKKDRVAIMMLKLKINTLKNFLYEIR